MYEWLMNDLMNKSGYLVWKTTIKKVNEEYHQKFLKFFRWWCDDMNLDGVDKTALICRSCHRVIANYRDINPIDDGYIYSICQTWTRGNNCLWVLHRTNQGKFMTPEDCHTMKGILRVARLPKKY